ncbi:hypothetical protein ACSBR1_028825 [Camellia fascicularis]
MAEESTLDFGIEEKDDREELGDFVRGESDYDDFGDGKRKKFEKDALLPTSYLRASVSAAVVSSSIQELGTDIEKHHERCAQLNSTSRSSIEFFGVMQCLDIENSCKAASMEKNGNRSLVGDLFGLLSAATYGLFTVLLKKFSGEKGERVDVQKLFGYIGLFTLVALWWLGCSQKQYLLLFLSPGMPIMFKFVVVFIYMNDELIHCKGALRRSGEESSEMESVYALKCHISHEVNHLHEGLKHVSAIAELMYLTIQFVRFFWKRESNQKAKILWVLSGEVGGQAPRRTKTLTLREVLGKSLNAWIIGGPSI